MDEQDIFKPFGTYGQDRRIEAAKQKVMEAKTFQDIVDVFNSLFGVEYSVDTVVERAHAIFLKLMKYIEEYQFPVYEDIKRFNNKDEIRKFLDGIKPQEIKALKLGSQEEYWEVLKTLKERVFPAEDGYILRTLKDDKGQDTDIVDPDHFTKDKARAQYLHTLEDTVKNSNVTVKTTEYDEHYKRVIEKLYYIKKYFDSDISQDIWDMVVVHDDRELVTKFSRKGNNRGRNTISGVMED